MTYIIKQEQILLGGIVYPRRCLTCVCCAVDRRNRWCTSFLIAIL